MPDTLNSYIYALGNPVMFIDRSGRDVFGFGVAVVGTVGAGIAAFATAPAWITVGGVMVGSAALVGIAKTGYDWYQGRASAENAAASAAFSFIGTATFGAGSLAWEGFGPNGAFVSNRRPKRNCK